MSSDVDDLRAKLNREIAKFNQYITLTNRTIEMMQQSDSLLVKKLSMCLEAIEEFNTKIALQQRQIRELTQIVRALSDLQHLELPAQSRLTPSPEQSDIKPSQPSSDVEVGRDFQPGDRRNDANDGHDT